MSVLPMHAHRVVIVGGGFSGTLLALKLAAAQPLWSITLVEKQLRAGRGQAYVTSGSHHLLNVPVQRMEVGLEPNFTAWLHGRPGLLAEALEESHGALAEAFVPRQLFGDYLEQQWNDALLGGANVKRVFGEAVEIRQTPRQVVLADSIVIATDTVILATGLHAAGKIAGAKASPRLIANAWRPGAVDGIGKDDLVLLLGTGLTMVDALLSLRRGGHKGPIQAVSPHGRLPQPHRAGGYWPVFLRAGQSPREAFASLREQVRQADARKIPWQRVFDASRPMAGVLWHGWSIVQRAQFLRHLKPLWDIHRHRLAERVASEIDALLWDGQLTITAGQLASVDVVDGGLLVAIRPRGEKRISLEVDVLVNCTGPICDPRRSEDPLMQNLLSSKLASVDALGLGLETEDCAVTGCASDWLFAVGAPTRPAWWEITAVPEIAAQLDQLVRRLSNDADQTLPDLSRQFLELGSGV